MFSFDFKQFSIWYAATGCTFGCGFTDTLTVFTWYLSLWEEDMNRTGDKLIDVEMFVR